VPCAKAGSLRQRTLSQRSATLDLRSEDSEDMGSSSLDVADSYRLKVRAKEVLLLLDSH
jgi:hypothetical protein